MPNRPLSRRERGLLRGLRRRKIREAEGLFIVEGVRVVEELLRSPISVHLVAVAPALHTTERGRRLAAELERRGPVRHITDRELNEFAATETPQGVIVIAQTPRTKLDEIPTPETAVLLVLDAVQDPGNFGTLTRTARALGTIGVAILPGTVDPWNPKAVRASAGTVFHTPIVPVTPDELEAWAHRNAFRVYGADAGGDAVESVRLAPRAVLLVGNEARGLTADGQRMSEQLVAVPIRDQTESLNVAVAAGILLYLLTR